MVDEADDAFQGSQKQAQTYMWWAAVSVMDRGPYTGWTHGS